MRIALSVLISAVGLALPLAALAAPPGFSDLPSRSDDKSPIQLRIVKYAGSTNGGMIVEVKNTGQTGADFTADGLFFVPDVDPEKAPQRLGAAGPFEVKTRTGWRDEENLRLAPGQTARLKLQVFCIDSHRGSPSSATPFRLARKRLPRELRQEIERGTKVLLKNGKVKNAKHIKGDVQGHVWKTRDKKWVPIEGERANEKGSPSPSPNQEQRRGPRHW